MLAGGRRDLYFLDFYSEHPPRLWKIWKRSNQIQLTPPFSLYLIYATTKHRRVKLSKQGGSEHQIHEHQIQKSGSVNNKW